MKRLECGIAVLASMLLAGVALAGDEKAAPQLRLDLDLHDGSHVIGVPGIESIPVQTAYAKMDIPLKQILTLKIAEDHETTSLDLQNGDKLKGVINLEPIKLQTIFGAVKIGIEHIRELRVLQAGGVLPDTLRKGLVLYYSFDKDEGGKVMDVSGKGHEGTVKGAKWAAKGKQGGGFEFAGGENYIDAGTSSDWDFDASRSWTFALWVCPHGSLNSMCFYGRAGGNDSLSGGENYLYYQAPAAPQGLSWGPVNGEWDTGATLEPDQWQHIVVTYNGSTQKAGCYVNGSQKASVQAGSVGTSSGSLRIGDNANINFFNGLMDEIMIFDRALSSDEVKQIYDAQR